MVLESSTSIYILLTMIGAGVVVIVFQSGGIPDRLYRRILPLHGAFLKNSNDSSMLQFSIWRFY